MYAVDLLALSVGNLSRRKGRAAMTGVGVVIGTAAIMVLVSLAAGLQRGVTEQFDAMADLTQIQVMPNYGMDPYHGNELGIAEPSQMKLINDHGLKELQEISDVSGVYPRDYLMMNLIKLERMEGYSSILGVKPDMLASMGYHALQGSLDLEPGTAVVGGLVWQGFYEPNPRPMPVPPEPVDFLNKTLQVIQSKWNEQEGSETSRTLRVRVVGVLPEMRGEPDYTIYVPLSDVEQWNAWVVGKRVDREKEGYPLVMVQVNDLDKVLGVADQISSMGYMVYTPLSYIQGITTFFTLLQFAFGGIGAVALLVAAIGIANTMTMAILERTREIGLMKAVGATHRDVMGIFVVEAAIIGFLGGLGGLLVGWTAGQMVNFLSLVYMTNQPVQMGILPPSLSVYTPDWLPYLALLLATLTGVLAGLYPALRAATLEPVLALRYE